MSKPTLDEVLEDALAPVREHRSRLQAELDAKEEEIRELREEIKRCDRHLRKQAKETAPAKRKPTTRISDATLNAIMEELQQHYPGEAAFSAMTAAQALRRTPSVIRTAIDIHCEAGRIRKVGKRAYPGRPQGAHPMHYAIVEQEEG